MSSPTPLFGERDVLPPELLGVSLHDLHFGKRGELRHDATFGSDPSGFEGLVSAARSDILEEVYGRH